VSSTEPQLTKAPIQVVAGLIEDDQGKVLVGQRLPGTHMAGFWEIPGGKCRSEESSRDALDRELHEELGIRVLSTTFLMTLTHQYPEYNVRLEVWRVEDYEGEVVARENQLLAWVLPEKLIGLPILPADEPLVEALLDH
jgi:8-oxo-dGTP diphosphatase